MILRQHICCITLAAAATACAQSEPPSRGAPPTAAQFEGEIAAFDSADRVSPPVSGGVVFTGSSSIRLWPDLAADFPGIAVSNRGFGGSTLPDVAYFVPRTVLPSRPRVIVLYAGDNDLAAGRTPRQVADDYRAFTRLVRQTLPAARIVYVSIKPSPSRWQLQSRMREANALIAAEIARDSLARFVNIFDAMLGANGHPRAELFRDDSLHMTAAGYALWRDSLAPAIARR